MKPIGGYFGFEESLVQHYHSEAQAINSGRAALEIILKTYKFSKVYVPVYTCSEVKIVVKKCQVEMEFYKINERLEPDFKYDDLEEGWAIVFTNYFGIKDSFLKNFNEKNFIIDNAQAFYYKNEGQISFNSARKFFGVLDGSFLYLHKPLDNFRPRFEEGSETAHLKMRYDGDTEGGYPLYQQAERRASLNSPDGISFYSDRILRAVDHDLVKRIRRENFNYLHSSLRTHNRISLDSVSEEVPMVYPFLPFQKIEKKKFFDQQVYVSTYWPNVLEEAAADSFEYELARNGIFIPVDQRYSIDDMKRILQIILN